MAVKTTLWLMAGLVGENVKFAAAGKVADTVTVLDAVDDAPVSLVTVRTTVYCAGREY